MTKGNIIVYHNGSSIIVLKETAEIMNLKSGQEVTETQLWNIIYLNASIEIPKLNAIIGINKKKTITNE